MTVQPNADAVQNAVANSSQKNFWDSKKVKISITSIVISAISILGWYFGIPDDLISTLIIGINSLSGAYVIGQSIVDSKSTGAK